jgi:hypothetical protein
LRRLWVPALVVISTGAPLACGDDTTQNDDEDSSSSDPSEETVDEGEESMTDPTADTTADSSSSDASADETTGSTGDSSGTDTSGSTSSDGDSESSSSDATDPESSSSDGGDPNACPAGELGPVTPDSSFGNTLGTTDDFAGTCGGAGAPDREYLFTAPADGTYTFDTQGSPLDTVLYVLDGECAGAELGCNDDGDGSQSAVGVDLVDGQTVTVVVDGNDAFGLPFEVRVQSGSFVCPLEDIGNTVPQTVSGDTTELFDTSAGSCGGQAGRDASYLFTAPATATYSFETFGSSFESVLYILDGTCSGNEISCGSEGTLADLTMGEQVTVVVDSQFAWGTFDLRIDSLGGACPDQNIGNTIPQTIVGDTTGGDNTDAGTCGGQFTADEFYVFTAPQDGLYQFDTFGSTLDTVLYVQDGGCGGSELACNDDWDVGETDSRIIQGLNAGQTVAIGVDGNGVGAYTLNVGLVPCPDDTLGNTAPQSVGGSTMAGINKTTPSCGDSGTDDDAPDYSYSFTAPEDGTYTFDTFGTFFDTTLYILDGAACNGAELACNDDFQFNSSSALSTTLAADQTVTVVVDGDFGSSGAYTLNVGQLSGTCPDFDLGNVVPAMAADTTAGADNAGLGSCGGLTGGDVSYTFTAPNDAAYRFALTGVANDAILYITDTCGGSEVTCDIADFSGIAVIGMELAASEQVVVTIDSNMSPGAFTLNIDEAPLGGDCCVPHDSTGCEVPEISDCVCALDPFCCNNSWDSICAGEASDDCGAVCPV